MGHDNRMGLDAVYRDLADAPGRCAAFSDFDGTLSNIIDDPALVEPIDGAQDVLADLARSLGTVAVVSGRPVAFLERFFSPPVELSGLYGLEHRTHDRLLIDSAALEWLPVMSRTADEAREQFGLEAVEDKRYSLTVHYRRSADDAERVEAWSSEVAGRTGLDARSAKMSVELHPPTNRSKGDVVADLLAGMRSAVYFGDDVGDLPAFERLHHATASGLLHSAATVLVATHETAPEMRELATNVVESPEAALDILRSFAS